MSYSGIHKRIPIRRGEFQTRPHTIQTRPCIIRSHIAHPMGVEQYDYPVYMIRHHHKSV